MVKRAPSREIFGWAMFDFANSSYTTVIITVVFSVIFPRIIVGDSPEFRTGNLLWSVALSVSYFIVLIFSPVIGAVTDFTAKKKTFLFVSYALTVLAMAMLYFVRPGYILSGMLLIILSNMGFSFGEAFISSFLPGLGPREELGKISGLAWGVGYIGGLLSTAAVLYCIGPIVMENFNRLRLTGPITALFFMLSAIPTFLWVREQGSPQPLPRGEHLLSAGIKRLVKTLKDFKRYRDLMTLLISFFFAYAGLSIVISFTFIYGDQVIKLSRADQALLFVITQITATSGAFMFGFLQDKVGAKKSFSLTLVLWMAAVTMICFSFQISGLLSAGFGLSFSARDIFLFVGAIAGLGLGSTQSTCRALIGLFSPENKAGEFYGLWNLSGKLASIFGLLMLGFLQVRFGLKNAIFLCILFFFAALICNIFVDEKRGRAASQLSM